jgi:hypothetical protein
MSPSPSPDLGEGKIVTDREKYHKSSLGIKEINCFNFHIMLYDYALCDIERGDCGATSTYRL